MSENKQPASNPQPKPAGMSNLAKRLVTAVVFVPILLWLLFGAPKVGFLALVLLAVAIGAWELFTMTQPKHMAQRVWGVLASLGVASVMLFAPNATAMATLLVGLVGAGALVALIGVDPIEEAGGRMGWLVAGPLYVGGLLSTLALLHQRDHGGGWVALAMMLAWLGDTGAYFAGRAFGKHKLYQRVSPNKTIEGAVGGVFGSVAGVLIAHVWFIPNLPLAGGIVLALIASVLGMAGDLVESLIKRSYGVKDSGWIVYGHGGLLDRVDALMFTAAATWIFTLWSF